MSNDVFGINGGVVNGEVLFTPGGGGGSGTIVVVGWYDSDFGDTAYLYEFPPTFGCAGIACVPYERRTVVIGCGASSIVPC